MLTNINIKISASDELHQVAKKLVSDLVYPGNYDLMQVFSILISSQDIIQQTLKSSGLNIDEVCYSDDGIIVKATRN